ncbi:pirin family protein [Croceivirga thetidis]|uniref:Pirin family protein n=1 Tax=Croceivirga thetidis TaxID=2721623 RepID=A0ABX1GSQ0_9FLAO|nr:pirin family protein [Croceivirga thetidis]NKI32066.1 pirin family protein [Croceivirga thetidis]
MNPILRIFPLGFPWETQDPFLFCVYHLDHYPKGTSEMGPDPELLKGRALGNDFITKDGWRMYHGQTIPGFPAHPHRGFETITIVNKGFCDHSDSLGAAGRFGQGDVQWMTAGRGVQHSEMFPLLNENKENTLELFQIWLNLPQKDKFTEPHFKMLWHEDIPIIKTKNARIQLIAGTYNNQKAVPPAPNSWAAEEENLVSIWTLKIKANTEFEIPSTESLVNRSLYFYEGSEINIDGNTINAQNGVDLDSTFSTHLKIGSKNASFLLLQGVPIGEPVAQQGPFVMNSQDELQKAFEEYRMTQFGGWPWRYHDNVHEKEKGRFALYPNGNLVEK